MANANCRTGHHGRPPLRVTLRARGLFLGKVGKGALVSDGERCLLLLAG